MNMGRGSSKVAGGVTKTAAKEMIVSYLTDLYKGTDRDANPVLLSKGGKYSVARNWDEARYAESKGWKYSPLSDKEAQRLGEKARKLAGRE